MTLANADGQTTDQIEATYSGTVAALLTATPAAFPQSSYVAWTTYQYNGNKQLASRGFR